MHGRVEAPHSNRRDYQNLKKISTYLWEYRGRVLLALACLMISKFAIVAVPLVLKQIIDTLDENVPDISVGDAGAASGLPDTNALLSNDVLLVGLGLVAAFAIGLCINSQPVY